MKLTVEAAGRSGTLSIFLSLFWQFFGIDPTDASLWLLETLLSGVSDWSIRDGKARVNGLLKNI